MATNRYKTYGAAAVSVKLLPTDDAFTLKELRFNLTTALAVATAATTMVINLNASSTRYNVILFSQAMVGITDLVWIPDVPLSVGEQESLTVTWANDAASFKAWGLEAIYDTDN